MAAGALPASTALARAAEAGGVACTDEHALDGEWRFRLDPGGAGEAMGWHQSTDATAEWHTVVVPHTWQVMSGHEEYRGIAWYRRAFDTPREWAHSAVRVEFEAVFHSATVWVNGQLAGHHLRSGYTAFTLDISRLIRIGNCNQIAVKVDNAFNESMVPRGQSSDWANDGGLYRPVRLLITPLVYIERVAVNATPSFASGHERQADLATIQMEVAVHNATSRRWQGQLSYRVTAPGGQCALSGTESGAIIVAPGETRRIVLAALTLRQPQLWHFDHPNLYELTVELGHQGQALHELNTTFGIRSIEVHHAGIYLNGERVRLMGVERMAGSNPEFGMAEPTAWIAHDHDDLKNLNCVLSRVHWQQDRRVLDYCDRHGILLQSEVPAWGYETFGDDVHPAPAILQNGLEQLREMIDRDRNHPCIISWGLCNEVGGQNPAVFEFAQRLYAEAKRLDPTRLCSYASNSLQATPERDVTALMDFIECNEYFGTWTAGTPEDLRRSLLAIHQAFPDKPLVISEYGYCACVPERPEGDTQRIEVLNEHTRVCRELDFVAGLIFFSYNDYRTHIGNRGTGSTRQRPHGVVNLYGSRKPSFEVLRRESSPVEKLQLTGQPADLAITLSARKSIPAHRLAGYRLRGIAFGVGDIPLERHIVEVPALSPGDQVTLRMAFTEKEPQRIVIDVMRPTGFSAFTEIWHG
jgi:beta-glucuronidase